ncbi:dTDP-4-amino-4,6-dideoxy-D-galactose acyltransferase [Pragia fontium]|uniref:dTDP-fucosamine acetyltransferase n=1 Tax=Pragia fontium DSM 5563 = ATCC 49100 TaxID=1122977 RepID=A0AAJ5BIG7_9GAMM|nr:dTDP-4-amino-4,6-dideoxy-D-galactose acyltransferase [Pragia fontium]SFD34508.1 dTDP-4-amino-4,6-dideoxy-D-galactose acyltransferase [Pragia fontium DSM 5563 = ATCC 49100]
MSARASIDCLEWESEFFALSTAKLSFVESVTTLPDEDVLGQFQLVQAKVPAQRLDVVDALSRAGFQLVEGEVDFILSIDLAIENALAPTFSCRLAAESDIPALRNTALDVFSLSRFRAPWYQPGDSGRFYALWVEKAVLGTFDHQCLILEDEQGNPQGFVTLRHLDEQQARIGLLAVWPGCGNKGVGLELMKAAKRWCAERGLNRLYVATQMGNMAALRLYVRSGASIHGTAYWLYR